MPRPLINTVGRWEEIADIQLNAQNTQVSLPTNGGQIPNDRFLLSLQLQFEGRITNGATTGPTGVQADGAVALLDTIQVQGYHRLRGQNEPFVVARGPDLYQLSSIYQTRNPVSTPASLATTAASTNDIRFFIPVPFTPVGVSLAQQVDFLLDAPNYDALKLLINYADDKNVFTTGAGYQAGAFSKFGATNGNPRIRVSGLFAQAGASQFAGYVPARTWRYFYEDTSSNFTTGGTGLRLANLPRGYRMRNIFAKMGTKATNVSSGNNSYATLSDTIAANIKVNRGLNKQIRFWADQFQAKEDGAQAYSFSPPAGYMLHDFAQHGTWHEAVDATALVAGPSGDVDFFYQADITGAANQAGMFLYEELRGQPGSSS